MRTTWLLASAILLAGCGSSTPPPAPPTEPMKMNKTMDPPAEAFERGAAVEPAEELVAWLDAQVAGGEPRRVRLPVVLGRGQVGFSLRGARVGGGAAALEIFVNDSALGIGLADRARQHCGDQPTCALWLEGRWRGRVDDAYQFDVHRVHEPIAADALGAADHAEVEP